MKGMKGMFFKKLKLINPEKFHTPQQQQQQDHHNHSSRNFRLSELLKAFQDEEMELEFKEPLTAPMKCKETEEEECPSLSDFEEKCPPGGSDEVIFYTTSLRSIRKTFEDCSAIRFLLQSFRIKFHERDVSMHMEFREELWKIMGGRVIPPRLFIKGKCIGGADEVVSLHEQGKLRKLLEGIPLDLSDRRCTGCGGVRFVVCSDCNGSRKVVAADQEEIYGGLMYVRCGVCNENGLVKCPICCC